MTDAFELIIDVQQKGVRATEEDLRRADEALTQLSNSSDEAREKFYNFDSVLTHLSEALDKLRTEIGDGAAQWKAYSEDVQKSRKESEEFDAKAEALRQTISKLRSEVAAAGKSRGFEKEISDLNKLEQAERRVDKARNDLYNTNRRLKRAEGNNDQAKVAIELEKQVLAIERVTKAETNLSRVRQQTAQQEEKQAAQAEARMEREERRIDDAANRLERAQSKYDFEKEATGLDKTERATLKLDRAQQELARSTEAVAAAQATGDVDQITRALNDQTRATQDAAAAQREYHGATTQTFESLGALRYANYDVARSMLAVSAAVTAAGTGLVMASSSYESSFTAVERTSGVTGDAVGQLKDEFVALTRELPKTFEELTNIGARGAQLGVATDQLTNFTEVIAQFVATSDTVTLDQAVEAIGRMSNLLGDTDFNRMGSAITLVGVNAAATEAQIIKTTQELAPFASAVGMSTDEVIGLAAAVASLGQPPERARSAFLTLQATVDKAVAGMNDKLGAFASVLGRTEEETARLWQTDPSGFVSAFVEALGATENLTVAFDNLGISEKRAVQVFTALASDARNAGAGLSVLEQALSDSNQGYSEGTELQRQYALILDDLASKWQLLKNAFMEVAVAMGDHLLPIAKQVIDVLTDVMLGLADFAASDIGGVIIKVVGVIGLLVSAYTLLRGSVALATGALMGLNRVTMALSANTLSASISGLIGQFRLLATSSASAAAGTHALSSSFTVASATSAGAAGGVGLLRLALTRLLATSGVGLLIVALGSALADLRGTALNVIGVIEWLFDTFGAGMSPLGFAIGVTMGLVQGFAALGDSASSAFSIIEGLGNIVISAWETVRNAFMSSIEVVVGWGKSFMGVIGTVGEFLASVFGEMIGWIGTLADAIGKAFGGFSDKLNAFGEGFGSGFSDGINMFSASVDDALKGARRWANTLPSMMDGMDGLSRATGGFIPKLSELGDEHDSAADAANNQAGAMGNLGNEIRTVKDYANDLQSVFSRAFEIRFSSGSTRDAITETFIKMREASDAAAQSIRSLKADIQGLQSDIAIQEYFLSIALEYGDAARAEAIQANLAKLQAELAEKTAKLNEEQANNSKTLTGNSKAAIENRKQMEDLVKKYQDHLVALASSGMGQEELARKTEELRQDFIKQATQLGYSRAEVEKYARAFDDLSLIISRVPEPTLKVNANPAIQALREYENALNKARANAGRGIQLGAITNPTNAKEIRRLALEAEIVAAAAMLDRLRALGEWDGVRYQMQGLAALRHKLATGNYWTGGFTGRGGVYEPAGIVHRGEYVIPQRDVNQRTGLPYADALGRLMRGIPGGSPAASVSGRQASAQGLSGHIASFGPMAVQQLAQAMAREISMNGKIVGEVVSNTFAEGTYEGAY